MPYKYVLRNLIVILVVGVSCAAGAETGIIDVDITNVLGQDLQVRVDLVPLGDGENLRFLIPQGKMELKVPEGEYRAYIHVYDNGVPVLVDIRDLVVPRNDSTFLLLSLLEGTGGGMTIRGFDSDGDLAIDAVELRSGTDPNNPTSMPGRKILPIKSEVLKPGLQWYRGDLFARSSHGLGTESVAKLIKRAEKTKLDFLAIADRNSMAPFYDKEFQSSKLVLIPAMEWGNDALGYALVYGAWTLLEEPSTREAAQAECIRVQSQGGVFAVSSPCSAQTPWLWELSHVNAIEVWRGAWRTPPPLHISQLAEPYRDRVGGQLVKSIAAAAARSELAPISANGQSTQFWDYELNRGLMASAIGGSASGDKKVPLGEPVTYIKARELSLVGLMEGLYMGRTYVSRGMNGPKIHFRVDMEDDGDYDVDIGGMVPTGVPCRFEIIVQDAVGKKVQLLQDGRPLISKIIEEKNFGLRVPLTPDSKSAFRVQVLGEPENSKSGHGLTEIYALTSPIYSRDLTREMIQLRADLDPNLSINDFGIRVEPDNGYEIALPENLPPHSAPSTQF